MSSGAHKTRRHTSVETLAGIPVVTVMGDSETIGTALGERFAPRLHVVSEDMREFICKYIRKDFVDADGSYNNKKVTAFLKDMTKGSSEYLHSSEPFVWKELSSLAKAAEIDIDELIAICSFPSILDECVDNQSYFESTTVSVPSKNGQNAILATVFKMPAFLKSNLVFIRKMPSHGPSTITLSVCGLYTFAGISASKLAVAGNVLRDSSYNTSGIPISILMQSMLSFSVTQDASSMVCERQKAGSYALHILDGSSDRKTWEFYGGETVLLPDSSPSSIRVHTNHIISDAIHPGEFSAIVLSRFRLAKIAKRFICEKNLKIDSVNKLLRTDGEITDPISQHDELHPVLACVLILDPKDKKIYCSKDYHNKMQSLTL